jgi:hypothetical protein
MSPPPTSPTMWTCMCPPCAVVHCAHITIVVHCYCYMCAVYHRTCPPCAVVHCARAHITILTVLAHTTFDLHSVPWHMARHCRSTVTSWPLCIHQNISMPSIPILYYRSNTELLKKIQNVLPTLASNMMAYVHTSPALPRRTH